MRSPFQKALSASFIALALGFAAFLSAAALGIAADGLFPWIPW